MRRWLAALLGLGVVAGVPVLRGTPAPEPGLLFYLSGDRGLVADYSAGGTAEPNFASDVTVIPDGAKGPGLQCGHTQLLSYWAPGQHLRGTRHALVLLALPRAGRQDAVPGLPRRLRRSFELGHGVAADRLQRRAGLRRVRHRRQPRADARVVRDAGVSAAGPVGAPRALVGRDARDPVLRRRPARRCARRRRRTSTPRSTSSARTRGSSAPTRSRAPTTSSAAATSTRSGSTTGCSRTTTWRRSPAGDPPRTSPDVAQAPRERPLARRVVVPQRLEPAGRSAAAARRAARSASARSRSTTSTT